jgi:hypothetical protein
VCYPEGGFDKLFVLDFAKIKFLESKTELVEALGSYLPENTPENVAFLKSVYL